MVVQENQVQSPRGREEKILVSVRLRPLNEKELAKNDVSDWECINGTSVVYRSHLSISERSMYPTAYTFDKVFGADCSTRHVYEEGAKEVALSVVRGVNASVFAYGQTSSGKTYTMSGITNYTITDIYEYIEKHKEREFILKFSAMEIYNESVRDLLSADSTPLRLLDDPEKGTVVEKLTEETLRDWNHFKELLSVCEAQRQIGETALNEVSSRSHQILKLTIESTAREFLIKDKLSALTATVNFIDLAGSERASQSLSAGTRLKEGCHINRSLLTLGTVIRKLSKGKNGHIPFRDSKLTRILQPSLGGNARSAIICTMSPAKIHVEQSRNTLLFASCAKDVTTNAHVNVVMSDKALVKHLQNELARMESQLRSPARPLVSSDTDMLQRKKDIEIEKLKREVMELTEQLRLARSQIEDLHRMVREEKVSKEMEKPSGEEKRPTVMVALENQYPRLRVKRSWELDDPTSESPMSAQSSCKDEVVESSNISPRSTQHRHVNCDETLAELTDSEASFLNTRCSIQPSVGVIDEEIEEHSYAQVEEIEEQPRAHEEQSDVPPHHASVETKGHSDGNSEDHCREVQCIEMESSSMNRCADSNISEHSSNRNKVSEIPECSSSHQYEVTETQLPCTTLKLETEAGNRVNRVNGVSGTSVAPKEESEVSKTFPHRGILTSGKNSPQLPVKDIITNRSNVVHPNFVSPSPEKPSPWLLGKETPRFRGLMLLRSRSCKGGFMSQSSLSWFEQDENITSMMPNWFEKQAIDLPSSIQSTPSASQYNVNNETPSPNYLSRSRPTNQSEKGGPCRSDSVQSKPAVLPYGFDSRRLSSSESQTDVYERETKSVEDSNSEKANGFARMNESNESTSTHDKQIIHHQDEETEMNTTSSFRDVALPWPLEFNRLQRDIIELWHTCNVSLGHRTYFFLLFRGDEKDCVYLEVEHRRLSFIKESFSRGSRAVEEGRTLSPSSSMRALNRERYKLSQQMQKKLTKEERENLFLRWGISLNTKHRRLQLAHRLWSESKDMEHIHESASVVGKLLGFVDMNLASKEMFGLNFTLRPRTKKPSRWKRSVLAFSIL